MYKSNSRENQDIFTISLLDKKRNGTYVEIGAQYPQKYNNTYLLEKEFDWTGISIEIEEHLEQEWYDKRENKLIIADAMQLDYIKIFEENDLDKHVDFLQLDIDPAHQTYSALLKIPFDLYSFSIITYEHDLYNGGALERIESRKYLKERGYTPLILDVMHDGLIFEDWYINENLMPNDYWKEWYGTNVNMDTDNMCDRYKGLIYPDMILS